MISAGVVDEPCRETIILITTRVEVNIGTSDGNISLNCGIELVPAINYNVS